MDPAGLSGEVPTEQALAFLSTFNAALAAGDVDKLKSSIYNDQAYWRDQLALTYHLRTFSSPGVIVAALLETTRLRGLAGGFKLAGKASFVPASPTLVREKKAPDHRDGFDYGKAMERD